MVNKILKITLKEEKIAWVYAFIIMGIISSIIAILRFFSIILFSFEFEVCIFYFPTFILFLFVLFFYTKQED